MTEQDVAWIEARSVVIAATWVALAPVPIALPCIVLQIVVAACGQAGLTPHDEPLVLAVVNTVVAFTRVAIGTN